MKILLFPAFIFWKIAFVFMSKDGLYYKFQGHTNKLRYTEWVKYELEYSPKSTKGLSYR